MCSAASVLSGRPLQTSSLTASTSRPTRVDRRFEHVLVAELQAVVVTLREELDVRVEELVGERVPHRDAVEQRRGAGAPLARLPLPDRRLALLDVDLVERERQEADVEVRAVRAAR